MKPDQTSYIIFKEDIEDFASWWRGNVADFHKEEALTSDFQAKHEKVRNMLLAIWCTDNKGHCDKSKCSLGWCIQDIDDKLFSGNFTFRKNNPNVIPAPDVIREYLGVNNLTKKQFEAFNLEEKLVLISGPAGTGKSVILIAKALQLAKSEANRKIVFFIVGITAEEGVKTAFEKANVSHCTLPWNKTYEMTTVQIIAMIHFKLIDNQVIIIHCTQLLDGRVEALTGYKINERLSNILASNIDCDVFIDDMQSILFYMDIDVTNPITTTLGSLREVNQANCYIWIAHDTAQDMSCLARPSSIQRSYSPFRTITLSKNLRNTYDISNSLSVMRDQIEEVIMKARERSLESIETIVKQTPGHYIRGPKINIHVFQSSNGALIGTFLGKELNKLQRGDVIRQSEIAVLLSGETEKIIKEQLEAYRCKQCIDDIPMFDCLYISSGEWPAVIVIHEFSEACMPILYLAMSRARVYCTVLLYSCSSKTLEKMEQFLSGDIKRYVNITRPYRECTCNMSPY